jgi:hypothetical protein
MNAESILVGNFVFFISVAPALEENELHIYV